MINVTTSTGRSVKVYHARGGMQADLGRIGAHDYNGVGIELTPTGFKSRFVFDRIGRVEAILNAQDLAAVQAVYAELTALLDERDADIAEYEAHVARITHEDN